VVRVFGRKHAGDGTKNHDCRHNEVNRMMMCNNFVKFLFLVQSSLPSWKATGNGILAHAYHFLFVCHFPINSISISLFSTHSLSICLMLVPNNTHNSAFSVFSFSQTQIDLGVN